MLPILEFDQLTPHEPSSGQGTLLPAVRGRGRGKGMERRENFIK
jgi:hypothetical protein